MYTNIFTDRSKGANHQFTSVADYIRQHDPKTIGINYAPHFEYHDEFATATACRRSTRRSSNGRSTRSTSIASSRPRRWRWAGTRRAARANSASTGTWRGSGTT